jgi:homoserine O-succinyltransferase
MPDAALKSTERQFRDLVFSVATPTAVSLKLFSLPEVARSQPAREHIAECYEKIDNLWTSRIDGVIVTGTEPHAPALPDEPYWPALINLMDWAEEHASSTILSCLAAHAAVLHLDGISRQPLPQKLSGLFECRKRSDHPIAGAIPDHWRVPHSRHNGLPEAALVSSGYGILSNSSEAGVDLFLKERKSLFIFSQGHPEYDPGTLYREYRRDVGRYLSGERATYPEMPQNYFDMESAASFAQFRNRAERDRRLDLLTDFPHVEAEAKLEHPWRAAARGLYSNWLEYLAHRKASRRKVFPSPRVAQRMAPHGVTRVWKSVPK